jgi:MFS family permease
VLVASTVSGRIITRTGRYKKFMIAGAVLLSVGLGLMGTIHASTNFVLVALWMVILGSGVGMLMQNLVLAVQNTLDVKDIGTGSATVAFFRTLGGAIGVSALGAVLSNRSVDLITDGLTKIGVKATGLSGGQLPDLSTLPGPVRGVVEWAMGDSIADLFLIATPVALVSLVAVLFLKEVPLGRRSGIQQAVEAQAATAVDERDLVEA